MSVGHYIAYTCSLDWATEYKNCPIDKVKKQKQQEQQQQLQNQQPMSQPIEKNVGKLKKIFLGRKASSIIDMSKNSSSSGASSATNGPTLNGGVEKPQNTICPGLKCCGIELKNNLLSTSSGTNSNATSNNSQNGVHNGYYEDNDEYGSNPNWTYLNGNTNSNSSSTSTPTGSKEPIWYMCDDDKIKTMSQREFEDLLSPNRKITVTPYLLFYARSDLQ